MNNNEKTLSIIKPDAVERNLSEDIKQEFKKNGFIIFKEKKIKLENKDENIIDAALRQNIELPFSCKGGMCCTCRCLVLEGEVMLKKNYSLERWEQERGYTLACQAKPKTDFVFLDFDRS